MNKKILRSSSIQALLIIAVIFLHGCGGITTTPLQKESSTPSAINTPKVNSTSSTSTLLPTLTVQIPLPTLIITGEPKDEFKNKDTILFTASPGAVDIYSIRSISTDKAYSECLSCEINVLPQSPISSDPKFLSPSWLSDGNMYSYVIKNRPADGIILREPDMEDRVLLSSPNGWFNDLQWSPNNRFLAFGRYYYKDTRLCYLEPIEPNPEEVCILPPSETSKVKLNAWSPDGKNILISSAGDKYRFYLWNIEDNSVKPFTDISGDDLLGKWSPDGSKFGYIVGTRVSESSFIPYQYDLYIADADGSNGQIVHNTNAAYDFDWSPDGSKIAFTQRSPIENDSCEVGCLPFTVLKIMDLETGEITSLTDGTEWIGDPSWRP